MPTISIKPKQVTKRLLVAKPAAVRILTSHIGPLPSGYDEYVTRFGQGLYSTFIRIYMPERISVELQTFHDRWRDYFLWDEEVIVSSKKQGTDATVITKRSLRGGNKVEMQYTLKRAKDGWRVAGIQPSAPCLVQRKF